MSITVSVFRPEEVELDQARLLDVVLVVLGDERRSPFLKHRHVIPERALADHDAGGVHAGVARQALELAALCRAARAPRVAVAAAP